MVVGFNHVLHSMYPGHSNLHTHDMIAKATKIKDAAKTASDHVKAQAEQIYQAYSVKN